MNNLLKELKDFYQEVIDSLDYICFNYPDFPLDIEVAMNTFLCSYMFYSFIIINK